MHRWPGNWSGEGQGPLIVADVELLHLSVKRGSAQPQELRCSSAVPGGVPENIGDVAFLIGFDRHTQIVGGDISIILRNLRLRQMLRRNPFTVAQNHGTLEYVIQLADITLPRK